MPAAVSTRPRPSHIRTPADPVDAVARRRRPVQQPTRQPERAYAVVLHDDAFNAIDHAARTLAGVLMIRTGSAWRLARQVHHHGHAVVWVGPAAAARVIAQRLTEAGPDPIMSAFGAVSLDVEVVTTDPNA